jgi:DNA polymerase elongation subunit (family B)
MHPFLSREKKIDPTGTVVFQIVDINAKDETDVSDDTKREYIIHLFGITKDSESVHLRITGFNPYFFVKVPPNFSTYQINQLKNHIEGNLSEYNRSSFTGCKLESRIDYYGYNGNKKEKFMCFYFSSRKCLYEVRSILQKTKHLGFIPKFYESKLEPFLRFLHIQNIQPAGWVSVSNYNSCFDSTCQIDIASKWKTVFPYETKEIAPFLQASFDIECVAGDGIRFPESNEAKDYVIQIGTTVHKLGSDNSVPLKHIVTLKSCDPIPGAIVESYDTEEELLLGWMRFMQKLDPDIITGYNIYGFDFKYIYERAKRAGILYQFAKLSRFRNYNSELIEKKLSSAALGSNEMYYMDSPGRLLIDLYKVCQRDYNFESYKLDNVAGEFICGKINKFKVGKKYTYLSVSSVDDLEVGNFIGITINKLTKFEQNDTMKFKVCKIQKDKFVIEGVLNLPKDKLLGWKLMKDDVKYTDIFKFQNKDAKHRCIVARYCLMDNILCNKLLDKLKILVNNIGMANVCYVPMSYLFLRGQGIKAYSLVAKRCRLEGYLIPDKEFTAGDGDKFQGATVLNATAGGYFHPISCNDFASLYPSSIISHNLSPDTFIMDTKYKRGIKYTNIVCNESTSYDFVSPEEGTVADEATRKGRGIIPKVLIELLASRKHVKDLMKNEKNPFQYSILDGLQLSYKLTCNSIYGQMGSTYSSIACKPVAESTTAIGRLLLETAAKETLILYPMAEIIYGDTDSIMTKYPVGMPENPTEEEKQIAIEKSIKCAQKVEEIVSGKLPWPHKLEYEKTYYPYILYSKKRYSGVMYEFDSKNYTKIDNKGIVLKRRDNAKIVKYIFGGALDIILFEQDIKKAHDFVKQSLLDLCDKKFSLDFLIISKTLKVTKTDPAHKILAQRMTQRDPGNAPNLNDRIPYIFVELSKKEQQRIMAEQGRKKLLQGDKIEHPDYVIENNLKPDYIHYITNQIMKPLLQLLSIFEEDNDFITNIKTNKKVLDDKDLEHIMKIKETLVEKKLFHVLLKRQQAMQNGMKPLDMFFKKK